MKLLPVTLLLVLFGSNCVLPLTHHYDSSDTHVKNKGALLHKLLKRQIICPSDDEYLVETHCCRKCMEGTYAKSHCDKDHGYSDCKPCTEGVDYMDEKNGYQHCQVCQRCDSMSGQELLQNCTVRQNAKCKCRKLFFCKEDKGVDSEDCTDCQHCTHCENGVTEPCTSRKDAVCNPPRNYYITCIILGSLVFVIATLFMYTSCGSNKESQEPERVQLPVFPANLQDIDLTDHLHSFGQELEYNTVLMFVRKMHLRESTIEAVKLDYDRSGIDEVKFQLLKKWYDGHGQKEAFQILITTLQNNNNSNSADRLMQLVKRSTIE
ncbi:tumor necrosis factor receptor superfamily member 6 isoform X2 [Pseudophryne corroboree]|uniref:tumor necrosis factor receptor superfamily member 6 isoform X2 n=1 Tax=Pseudophryne corroboree TaxID=495146 RepID=UPI0030815DBF